MNFTSHFHAVLLSAIDLDDMTYCLAPWEDPYGKDLLASIKRFGILHPPILQPGEKNNSYSIIAGRKRIAAARHLTPDGSILCCVVPADIEETAIFSLLLEEAETGRPLSITEQIVFFEKLLRTAPIEEAVPMLEQLGYKPQKHIITDLLQLRSLSESALQALHYGIIGIKNARKLLNLTKTDQKLLIPLITELHFGGSKQQKLIDLCRELIMRKNTPLEKILADFPSADSQKQPVNIPQYGAALLSWLHNECFPQVTQAENTFQQQVARLDLPSTMHIDHSPAFENEEVTLSLRFSDWRSLNIVFGGIKKLIEKE